MAQKRVLPVRSNRGKRPQQTQQQIARQDIFYNAIFEVANNPSPPTQKNVKKMEYAQLESERKQFFVNNKVVFPYSRGYHYFFDLTTFQRVDGSVSYALDENNAFNSTFSQQNLKLRDGLTVGSVLNRKMFGLPTNEIIKVPKTRDKNICHVYLFQNEDRKYQIDRMLYELKQIQLNLQKLINSKQMTNFNCLKKDVDLLIILEESVSVEEKKKILNKKIKILQQKKLNMKLFLFNQDHNFYYHSLNQKLHDQIQQMSQYITHEYILTQICYAQYLREQLSKKQQLASRQLQKLFYYYQTQKPCITQKLLQTIITKIDQRFFNKVQNQQIYSISIPFIFFNFCNCHVMMVSQKILAFRLAQQNQASFYICKMLWKRVFERDLIVNKQMKPLTKAQYDKLMSQTLIQLNKWKKWRQKQKQNKSDQPTYPQLDNLINWNVFDPQSHVTDLFTRQKQVQINVREFICIVLFYRLYLCISEIYQFILNNQNFGMLIAHDFYSKAHNYIVQCIGTPGIGILDQVLKKFSQCIIRSDIDINFKLKFIYNESIGAAYVIKTGMQSEWQTQKQDENQNNDNQQIVNQNQKKAKSN